MNNLIQPKLIISRFDFNFNKVFYARVLSEFIRLT